MKTLFKTCIILTFCLLSEAKAQNIGINGTGATAHPSALLDIDAVASPSLGVLIPRIALQAINVAAPVTSPATSLLVYNTATASTGTNAVSAGYYFWDGTKWVRFAYNASGSFSEAWTTLGNAGTNPSTNFLGTTDAQDLVFRTINLEAVRINTVGNVGIGTNNPDYKLDIATNDISLIAGYGKVLKLKASHPTIEFEGTNGNKSGFIGYDSQLTSEGMKFFVNQTPGILVNTALLTLKSNQNVGIGTTTPANKLEITHSTAGNSGLRFTNLPNASVLKTDANGDVLPATASTATNNGVFWGLNGNAGTNPATNFLGTTDAQDLVFRTNNLEAVRVTTVGNVGIGTTTATSKLSVHNLSGDNGQPILKIQEQRNNNTGGFNQKAIGLSFNDTIHTILGTNGSSIAGILDTLNYFYINVRGKKAVESNSYLSPEFVVHTNKNIGIGTIAPTNKLHIVDNVDAGSGIFVNNTSDLPSAFSRISFNTGTSAPAGGYIGTFSSTYGTPSLADKLVVRSGSGTANGILINAPTGDVLLNTDGSGLGAHLIVKDVTGNVGIGTTAPANKLEITQGTAGNSGLRFTNLPNASALSTNSLGDVVPATASTATNNGVFWGLNGNAGTNPATNFLGTTDAQNLVLRTNNVDRMYVLSSGEIGVGVSPTIGKLQVRQSVDNSAGGISITNSISAVGYRLWVDGNNNGRMDVGIAGTGSLVINTGGGNVGIGATSAGPLKKLQVNLNDPLNRFNTDIAQSDGIRIDNSSTADSSLSTLFFSSAVTGGGSAGITGQGIAPDRMDLLFWNENGTTRKRHMIIKNNGNVGIGTNNPQRLFHVKSATNANSVLEYSNNLLNVGNGYGLLIQNNDQTNNNFSSLMFGGSLTGTNKAWAGIETKITNHTAGLEDADIYFATINTGTYTTKAVIKNNGNVGIGTVSPTSKFHVLTTTANAMTVERSNSQNAHIEYKNTIGTVFAGLSPSGNYAVGYNLDLSVNPALTILNSNNNVGIGTSTPTEKLEVAGNVKATSFIATTAGVGAYIYNTSTNMTVPDYVFENYYDKNTANNPAYKLLPLAEVESYLQKNKHLPRVPSREELQKEKGINLQGLTMVNLEKTEENTLYILELKKRIDQLEKQNAEILELLKKK